jgi:hypothetical protein
MVFLLKQPNSILDYRLLPQPIPVTQLSPFSSSIFFSPNQSTKISIQISFNKTKKKLKVILANRNKKIKTNHKKTITEQIKSKMPFE